MARKEFENLSIKISCDCEDIDEAIKKLSRLNELLKEAIELLGSIKN